VSSPAGPISNAGTNLATAGHCYPAITGQTWSEILFRSRCLAPGKTTLGRLPRAVHPHTPVLPFATRLGCIASFQMSFAFFPGDASTRGRCGRDLTPKPRHIRCRAVRPCGLWVRVGKAGQEKEKKNLPVVFLSFYSKCCLVPRLRSWRSASSLLSAVSWP